MTRSSSTRSAPVAAGQRVTVLVQGVRRIGECPRQQVGDGVAPGAERTECGRTAQQRADGVADETSVRPWPPASAALTRAVAKLVPLQLAQPASGLG